jgi:hypothetical protein
MHVLGCQHVLAYLRCNTMATKPKATPTQAATPQAATTQVATTQAVPAATQAVPATYAGLPFAQLTKSQQSFATAKAAPTLGALAPVVLTLVGAKAYRVRSGNNAHWWQAITGTLASGPAQAQAMVAAGACPKFVAYAVARGWLVKAAA